MRRITMLAALAAVTLSSFACGGSDHGTGAGIFNGSYALAQYSALRSFAVPADETADAAWGRVVSDGLGMLTPTIGMNEDGAITAPAPQPPEVYSEAADGTLVASGATGGIAADGVAAVLASTATGSNPEVTCLLKTGGSYSPMTFSGNYHLGLLVADPGAYLSFWTTTAQGALAPDGSGGGALPVHMSNSGGNVGVSAGGPLTYSVAADGTLTITVQGGTAEGGILADGSFAVAAGTTAPGFARLLALIKHSTAATDALFSGSYWAAGISSDPSSNGDWTSFVGSVIADGAGNMNYVSTTENHEGAISMPTSVDTYAITADGTLTSGDRIGAITSDGKYAFLSGENTTGSPPTLFFFVRK